LKFIKEIISSSDNIVALSLNGGSHPDVEKSSHEAGYISTPIKYSFTRRKACEQRIRKVKFAGPLLLT